MAGDLLSKYAAEASLSYLQEEGEVDLTNDAGSVRVQKGQGTRVRGRGFKPGNARKWQSAERQNAYKKVALKRRQAVQERIQKQKEQHKEWRRAHRKDLQERILRKVISQRRIGPKCAQVSPHHRLVPMD